MHWNLLYSSNRVLFSSGHSSSSSSASSSSSSMLLIFKAQVFLIFISSFLLLSTSTIPYASAKQVLLLDTKQSTRELRWKTYSVARTSEEGLTSSGGREDVSGLDGGSDMVEPETNDQAKPNREPFGGFVGVGDVVMPAQKFCVNYLRQTTEKRSKQWMEETVPSVKDGTNIRTYVVCEVDQEDVDNWLRTPFIPRGTANRISIEVTFTMRDCREFPRQTKTCGETFTLLYHEANQDYDKMEIPYIPPWKETPNATDGYRKIDRITGDQGRFSTKDQTAQNREVRSVTMSSGAKGVYIGFRDEGACTSVQGVRVYYDVCEETVANLAWFEETPTGKTPTDLVEASGVCVGHATLLKTGVLPKQLCKSDGTWAQIYGECVCIPGYVSSGVTCRACVAGEYSVGEGSVCKPCPAHSRSRSAASKECECEAGYYRASKVDTVDNACTQPPSKPLNVRVVSKNENSAVITWMEPKNKGGREELWYRPRCDECPSGTVFTPGSRTFNQTNLTIYGLLPSATITLFIFAENEVSKEIMGQSMYSVIEITTSNVAFDVRLENLKIESTSATSLKVIWDPPSLSNNNGLDDQPSSYRDALLGDADGGKLVTVNSNLATQQQRHQQKVEEYQVEWYTTVGNKEKLAGRQTTRNDPIIHINNLDPHTEYRIRVRALVEEEGWGSWSYNIYGQTLSRAEEDEKRKKAQINNSNNDYHENGPNSNGNDQQRRPSSVDGQNSDDAAGTATIILIVVGCIIVIGLFILTVCWCYSGAAGSAHRSGGGRGGGRKKQTNSSDCDALDFKSDDKEFVGNTGQITPDYPNVTNSTDNNLHRHLHDPQTQQQTSPSRHQLSLTKKLNSPLIHPLKMPPDTGGGYKPYVDPTIYEDPNLALREFANEIDQRFIIIEQNILGGGEFGQVYQGKLRMTGRVDELVAVKCLKPGSSQKIKNDFLQEAAIMGQFEHPNVIRLVGVKTKNEPVMIITEFMEHKSLDTFLRQNDGQFSGLYLLRMLTGVCAGMKYLSDKGFVHRDLAARNVLVNSDKVCKISDFGLSRVMLSNTSDAEQIYTTQGGKIPVRWTAPEAITHRKYTSASDIWSFGIVIWEVTSFGERPYWDWSNQEVIKRVNQDGYRLPPPMNCPAGLTGLMLDCWRTERTERPTFGQLFATLEQWSNTPALMDKYYTDPNHSSALLLMSHYSSPSSHYEHHAAAGLQQHSSHQHQPQPPSIATTTTPLQGSASSLDSDNNHHLHIHHHSHLRKLQQSVGDFLGSISLGHYTGALTGTGSNGIHTVGQLCGLQMIDLIAVGIHQTDAERIRHALAALFTTNNTPPLPPSSSSSPYSVRTSTTNNNINPATAVNGTLGGGGSGCLGVVPDGVSYYPMHSLSSRSSSSRPQPPLPPPPAPQSSQQQFHVHHSAATVVGGGGGHQQQMVATTATQQQQQQSTTVNNGGQQQQQQGFFV